MTLKFNLKNRPSHKWMYENLDKIEQVEKWFEGFEKELQDRLLKEIAWNPSGRSKLAKLIKEILGETETRKPTAKECEGSCLISDLKTTYDEGDSEK